MSKYYTPQKEEFHIGFEYEVKSKGKWIKTIFNDGRSAEQYTDMEIPVRVKKLDKDDIESLGWELQNNLKYKERVFILQKEFNSIEGNGITKNFYLYFKTNSNVRLVEGFDSIYFGFIRNKSELKLEMKKLNLL